MERKEEGLLVSDIYSIAGKEGKLGRGSYGVVRLGYHERCGIIAAKCSEIKQSRTANHEKVRRRINEEAENLQKAKHPNVVHVHGVVQWPGAMAIIMEYMPGGNLMELLADSDVALPYQLRSRMCAEIANGLSYIHTLKMNHGDIKPENILLSRLLNCKIADFGSAKLQKLTGASSSSTRAENQFTEIYASPKLLKNPLASLTDFDDIYSYSITVAVILLREIPIDSHMQLTLYKEAVKSGQRPMLKAIDQQVIQLQNQGCKLDVEIVNSLKEITEQCWHIDAEQRPPLTEVYKKLKTRRSSHKFNTFRTVTTILGEMDSESLPSGHPQWAKLDQFKPPGFSTSEGTLMTLDSLLETTSNLSAAVVPAEDVMRSLTSFFEATLSNERDRSYSSQSSDLSSSSSSSDDDDDDDDDDDETNHATHTKPKSVSGQPEPQQRDDDPDVDRGTGRFNRTVDGSSSQWCAIPEDADNVINDSFASTNYSSSSTDYHQSNASVDSPASKAKSDPGDINRGIYYFPTGSNEGKIDPHLKDRDYPPVGICFHNEDSERGSVKPQSISSKETPPDTRKKLKMEQKSNVGLDKSAGHDEVKTNYSNGFRSYYEDEESETSASSYPRIPTRSRTRRQRRRATQFDVKKKRPPWRYGSDRDTESFVSRVVTYGTDSFETRRRSSLDCTKNKDGFYGSDTSSSAKSLESLNPENVRLPESATNFIELFQEEKDLFEKFGDRSVLVQCSGPNEPNGPQLALYFLNRTASNGGPLSMVTRIPDGILVVFHRREDALRVAIKKNHVIDDVKLKVYRKPIPSVYSEVLLIKMMCGNKDLKTVEELMECCTSVPFRVQKLSKSKGFVVVFQGNADIEEIKRSVVDLELKSIKPEVIKLCRPDCMKVQGIKKKVSDDFIKLSFMKKKLGDCVVTKVERNEKDGSALVYFADYKSVKKLEEILRKDQIKVAGSRVKVRRFCAALNDEIPSALKDIFQSDTFVAYCSGDERDSLDVGTSILAPRGHQHLLHGRRKKKGKALLSCKVKQNKKKLSRYRYPDNDDDELSTFPRKITRDRKGFASSSQRFYKDRWHDTSSYDADYDNLPRYLRPPNYRDIFH